MIVYFANRNLDVLGTASTNLPEGIVIIDDKKKEDIESGVRTFEVTFVYDDTSRELIQDVVSVGNFLLRSADDDNEFYTIVTTEHNTEDQTVYAYCEDAGLDLLNTVAPAYESTSAHDPAWYVNHFLPAGWTIGENELEGSQTLSWDGDSTVTERLLSIVNSFGGELDFSYDIDRLLVTTRKVNLYKKRGNQLVMHQLRLGGDVAKIVTNKSIENLATAFEVTGGTPKGKSKPITLSGANYSSDGTTTHTPADPNDPYQISGTKVVCTTAMQKWASKLDSDGLLLREFSYDTTNKKMLFSQAVAELRKVVDEETTYEVDIITLPESVRLGDKVHVVDDKNNLYLEGRILELERSITQVSNKVTLGEWIIRGSGISERLKEFAREFQNKQVATTVVTLTSSDGTVFDSNLVNTTITVQVTYGDTIITNQTMLDEVFESASLQWYKDGVAITSTATHVISDNGFTLQLVNENIASVSNYEVKVNV